MCNTAGYQTSTTDGVYVDGKCWKATVVCNGTTRELTAQSIVLSCNSPGGSHSL